MKKEPRWVVDPDGNIVKLAPGAPLKDGWRDASKADLSAAADVEKARAEVEAKAQAEALAAVRAEQDAKDEVAPKSGGPLKTE